MSIYRGPAPGRTVGRVLSLALVALVAGTVPTLGRFPGPNWAEDARVDPALRLAILDARYTPTERFGPATVPGSGDRVSFVLEGPLDPARVDAAGGRIVTRAGGITTVLAPLSRAGDLAALPGVTRIALARPVHPASDVSVPETGADQLWESDGAIPPVYHGLTGRGVVVGIVDTGLDLTHADFCTPDGSTRVRFAWDQTWAGNAPSDFGYGTEYTQGAINAGAAAEFKDTDGHGTHVAGIAAGDGSAGGATGQPYHYVGMAPEADLIVVKTNLTDAGIIDGVNYVFTRAGQLGLPAVVELSVTSQHGGHDGSSALDEAVSALTGPGRLVAAAAGNDGNRPIHARVEPGPGETGSVPFTVPDYTPTTLFAESVFLEGWHDGDAAFRVALTSPSGAQSAWVGPGESSGSVSTDEGTFRIDNDQVQNDKGGRLISVTVWRSGTAGAHPASGTWTLSLARESGTASGLCHFWIVNWTLSTTGSPAFVHADPSVTVASPATGDGVIATGAYATMNRWTNATGSTSSFGNIPLGAIAGFSAVGPRRDGVQRPDLVAPGYGVVASLSADAPASDWERVADGVHSVRAGTSQASAHTAGALALLLEGRRRDGLADLDPETARTLLRDGARTDSYTGDALPDPRYGYGKLFLAPPASPAAGGDPPPAGVVVFTPYPNPAAGPQAFRFSVEAGAAGPEPATLRIFDVRGRLVASCSAACRPGDQELVWDGRVAGRPAPSGLYLARLHVGDRTAVRKIVRLDR